MTANIKKQLAKEIKEMEKVAEKFARDNKKHFGRMPHGLDAIQELVNFASNYDYKNAFLDGLNHPDLDAKRSVSAP